jgi:hypothetical protein
VTAFKGFRQAGAPFAIRYRRCRSWTATRQTPASTNEPVASREDRRVAPRLRPDEVPWITEVTPVTGERARLLNISTTGVLLETTARLEPGRQATVVIVTDSDLKHQADGQIVRTELVSIGKGGELVYRTAMAFVTELDLRSPATRPAQADAACVQPQLEGPLPGRWKSSRGSKKVKVTHITIGGCYVLARGSGVVDEPGSITITCSPGRPLTLQGKVAAVEAERGFLVQFDELPSETRRALRLEICEGIARGAAAPPQPVAVGTLVTPRESANLTVEWPARRGAVHAGRW